MIITLYKTAVGIVDQWTRAHASTRARRGRRARRTRDGVLVYVEIGVGTTFCVIQRMVVGAAARRSTSVLNAYRCQCFGTAAMASKYSRGSPVLSNTTLPSCSRITRLSSTSFKHAARDSPPMAIKSNIRRRIESIAAFAALLAFYSLPSQYVTESVVGTSWSLAGFDCEPLQGDAHYGVSYSYSERLANIAEPNSETVVSSSVGFGFTFFLSSTT